MDTTYRTPPTHSRAKHNVDIKRAQKELARLRRQRDRAKHSRQEWVDAKMGTHKTQGQLAEEGVETNPGPRGDDEVLATTSDGRGEAPLQSAPPAEEVSERPRTPSPKLDTDGRPMGRGPKSGRTQAPRTCHNCGKAGHKAAQCRDKGKEPEELATGGSTTAQVLTRLSQVERANAASLVHSRHADLSLKQCFTLVDAGFLELSKNVNTPTLLAAAGLDPPAPVKQEAPRPPRNPILGSFLTADEFRSTKKTWHVHQSYGRCVARVATDPVYWVSAVIFCVVVPATVILCTGYAAKAAVWATTCAMSTVAAIGAMLLLAAFDLRDTDEIGYEVVVELDDQSSASDDRLRTLCHVARLDRPVRVHRYSYRKPVELFPYAEWKDMYVVDHWAAVAQSEFGYGQDVDSFLKNVHLKFLRCGELDVSSDNYELYKRGTTEYLARWCSHQGFRAAAARNWHGREAGDE